MPRPLAERNAGTPLPSWGDALLPRPPRKKKKKKEKKINRERLRQGWILSPCLFNLYAEYIMRNGGLEEAQARIKIAGRNINNLRYADDTLLWQEAKKN